LILIGDWHNERGARQGYGRLAICEELGFNLSV
jgi:hypothetical protein